MKQTILLHKCSHKDSTRRTMQMPYMKYMQRISALNTLQHVKRGKKIYKTLL